MRDLDLACAATVALLLVTGGLAGLVRPPGESGRDTLARALRPVVGALVALRVSANAITAFALGAGLIAGVAIALGHLGVGAAALAVASLGDSLDGLVARETGTASAGGGLFDASADRYQEFALLGGLALRVRSSAELLLLTMLALVGSFMVSYGSAKAEALGALPPRGVMRREHRAVCMLTGVTLSALGEIASSGDRPWLATVPLVVALGVVGVLANASAVLRLRAIAVCVLPGSPLAVRRPATRGDVVSRPVGHPG